MKAQRGDVRPSRGTAALCGRGAIVACACPGLSVTGWCQSKVCVAPCLSKAVGIMSWGLPCWLDIRVRGEAA